MQENACVKSKGFTLFEKEILLKELAVRDVLRVSHVAVMLDCHPITVYKKASKKRNPLPSHKNDGTLHFLKREVSDWVQSGRTA